MHRDQVTKHTRLTLKSHARLLAALTAGVCSAGVVSRAAADTWVWTAGELGIDWATVGNWEHTSGASNSAVPVSSPNTIVQFAGSTGTAPIQDISNPIELNSLGFNAGASTFALQGDALDFLNSSIAVAPTIVQNSSSTQDILESITLGNNTTISGSGTGTLEFVNTISGGGSLTDSAAATVELLASNSYGGTTINNGAQILINNNNSFGTGAITFTGGTITAGATLSMDNTFNNNTGSAITFQAASGATMTVNPSSALFGSLNFGSSTETGTINFEPATFNTFGGAINVNGGTLVDGAGSLASVPGIYSMAIAQSATFNANGNSENFTNLTGAGTLATGGSSSETLTLQAADFSGVISGSGQLVTTNTTGTVILTGVNSYSGGTTLGGGTVGVGNEFALGGLSRVTVTGNINLYATHGTQTLSNPFTLNSGKTLTIVDDPNGANNLTLNAVITGSGAIVMSSTGTLSLSAVNSYTGGTTINSGQVNINNSNSLGSTLGHVTFNAGTLTATSNASLNYNYDDLSATSPITFQAASGVTLTLGGGADLGPETLDFGSSTDTGTIDFSPGIESVANTTLNVNGGTLLDGDGLLPVLLGSAIVNIAQSATLNLNNDSTSISNLTGAGTIAMGTNASATLTLISANFSGNITGSGKLVTSNSTGTVILTGSNSYSGGSTFGGGLVGAGNGSALGSGTVSVTANTSLYAQGAAQTLNNPFSLGVDVPLTIVNDPNGAQNLTLGGSINGFFGQLIMKGTGELILTGTNNYSGGTALDSGQIIINNANSLGTEALTFNGSGTLTASSTLTLGNDITDSATTAITFQAAAGTTMTLTGDVTLNPSQTLDFGSSTDTGTVIYSPDSESNVTSTINVNGGTLTDGNGLLSALLAGNSVTIAQGATLNLNGFIDTINDLLGSGTLATGTSSTETFTLKNSNFSGNITGSGNLIAAGGIVVLSGSNSYSGGTSLNSGDLVVGNNNSLGSGLLTLNAGTLDASTSVKLTNNLTVPSSSTVSFLAAAGQTLTLAPTNGTFESTDVLNFGSASQTGAITFSPTNVLFGSGALTGHINVNDGMLNDGNSGLSQLISAGEFPVTIASSATMNLNGNSTNFVNLTGAGTLATGTNTTGTFTLQAANFSGSITGSGKVLVPSGSTATLSGSNTYSGGTTIDGQVIISNANSLGTGPITFNRGTITALATLSLENNFTSGTTAITFEAASGTTLTVSPSSGLAGAMNFGSAGETGTVNFVPTHFDFFGGQIINVNGGTLLDGGDIVSQILPICTLDIAQGATLNINGFSPTISNLTGAGTLATGTNTSETFTMETANFSGTITGSGQFVTSNSSGTVILAGSNTYSGGSTFGGGTVGVGNNSALSSGVVTVTANTNLYAEGADKILANPVSISSAQSLTIVDDPNGSHNLALTGNISGSGSLVMSGTGVLSLFGANSYSGGTTINSGTLAIDATASLPVGGAVTNNSILSIQDGTAAPTVSGAITGTGTLKLDSGILQLAANSGGSFQNALTISTGSTLDLTDNSFIVNYGTSADPAATIRAELVSGFNASGARWAGTGITSSLATADPAHFAVGYEDGGNARDRANTGVPVGEVGIEYTVAGDANLSGAVDLSDLVIIASDFGMSGADWAEGDLNYDGNVDLSDLVIVASNFGASLGSVQLSDFSSSFASEWQLAMAEAHSADVTLPEPGALLAMVAAGGLLKRRRQNKANWV